MTLLGVVYEQLRTTQTGRQLFRWGLYVLMAAYFAWIAELHMSDGGGRACGRGADKTNGASLWAPISSERRSFCG
jgi:hypothetical protein